MGNSESFAERATETLRVAIAIISESMNEASLIRLPSQRHRQRMAIDDLAHAACDISVLTQACLVLLRRSEMLGK